MADRQLKYNFLFSIVILALTLEACQSEELVVTHSPSYVTFQESSKDLQASDVPKVITQTLGVTTNSDLDWSGLLHGSVFKRPKANVLVSIEMHEGLGPNPLKLKTMAKYPVRGDVPSVDVEDLMNTVQNAFFDKTPLMLDAAVDNSLFNIRSEFSVFRKLPDTLRKMSDRLLDMDSVMQHHPVGSLNSSVPVDLTLMGELQLIQDVLKTLYENSKMLKSKTPDLFSFSISGLRGVVEKHGPQSTQAGDAAQLVTDFINKMTKDFRKLYKDNVVVEVLTMSPANKGHVRKVRSLKADPTTAPPNKGPNINLSKDYDENYPAFFNIILWFMIIFAVFTFAVSYGMWNMDPGRDSIIYRMTSTRLKKD